MKKITLNSVFVNEFVSVIFVQNNHIYSTGLIISSSFKYLDSVKLLINTISEQQINNFPVVTRYKYDAYGNHKVYNPAGNIDTDPTSIGNINPIRYRSYYFDTETGFYYCKSRYYVPYLRRWLTMDSISYIDKEKIQGSNLFAYCLNNPVMYKDESGNSVTAVIFGIAFGLALLAFDAIVGIALYQSSSDNSFISNVPLSEGGIRINNGFLVPGILSKIVYLKMAESDGVLITNRTIIDLVAEWILHNAVSYTLFAILLLRILPDDTAKFLYQNLFIKHTKDVDLENKED